jgi:hypothetical protein
MPSASAAQHRWIGWLHSDNEARKRAGMSKETVDEWLHADRGSPWKHRAMGGMMPHRDDGGSMGSIGGIEPTSSSQNPISSSVIQRYSSLSNEKLQELSSIYGNSTMGKIASSVLKQRQMMPNTTATSQATGNQLQTAAGNTQQAQQQTQQQPQQQKQTVSTFNPQQLSTEFLGTQGSTQQAHRGGGLAMGGNPLGVSMSMADPPWVRSEQRSQGSADRGLLLGSTMGRADAVKTSSPSGSYILPAEMVSGLGEGNGLAGARLIQEMTSTGPFGTSLPRMTHGRGPPSPPHVQAATNAKGGGVQNGPEERTPVALSHMEYKLTPRDCIVMVSKMVGHPVPLDYAHRVLDKWVKFEHKRHAEKLAKLAKQGPVTS